MNSLVDRKLKNIALPLIAVTMKEGRRITSLAGDENLSAGIRLQEPYHIQLTLIQNADLCHPSYLQQRLLAVLILIQ